MTPLDRVTGFLKANGFRDAQQPFGIGSATFRFDVVLTAEKTLNLVILQDTTVGSIERLRREILAFGRSLDVLGSRRTLTLVLVGQRIDAEVAETVIRFWPAGGRPERTHSEALNQSDKILRPDVILIVGTAQAPKQEWFS